MNTFLSFLKKFPWWFWVGIVVAIIIIWQIVTAGAMANKLYKMALDNLRADQGEALKQKDEWIKTCEDQIAKLAEEKAAVQKQKVAVQQEANRSAAEVARLKGENNALRIALQNIVVPTDPDKLVDGLRKRFPSIRKVSP